MNFHLLAEEVYSFAAIFKRVKYKPRKTLKIAPATIWRLCLFSVALAAPIFAEAREID